MTTDKGNGRATQRCESQYAEADRVVTVARDGARMVWVTVIYEARRRQRDGVLTWRRVCDDGARGTAGRRPTGPMVDAAIAYAAAHDLPYCPGIRHGLRADEAE